MIVSKGSKILVVGDRVRFDGEWQTLVCYSDKSFTLCQEGKKGKSDIKTYKGDPYFCLYKER